MKVLKRKYARLAEKCSILDGAAMIDIGRVSLRKATDDKKTVQNGIRLCMESDCFQAYQRPRPHVDQAFVLVSDTLVLVLGLVMIP